MADESLVDIELEALEVTYGDVLQVLAREPLRVSLQATPYTGQDDTKQFVKAVLELSLTHSYPDSLPDIRLRDCKGLGDARQAQLHSRLREEAAGLSGSMMLGHLCETARDLLTAMNSPEGDCIFCRCALLEGEDGSPSTSGRSEQLLKLPCYHAYHFDCFARWWRWEQRSLNRQRKQVIQELGAQAGSKLHPMGLVPDARGLFNVLCPSCRFRVGPQDLAHALPRLAPKRGSPEAAALEAAEREEAAQRVAGAAVALAAAEMEQLRLMQRQHARLFEQQKKRGCLMDASWGVSLGLQPSQQGAAAAREGEDSNGGVDQLARCNGSARTGVAAAENGGGRRKRATEGC